MTMHLILSFWSKVSFINLHILMVTSHKLFLLNFQIMVLSACYLINYMYSVLYDQFPFTIPLSCDAMLFTLGISVLFILSLVRDKFSTLLGYPCLGKRGNESSILICNYFYLYRCDLLCVYFILYYRIINF